MYALSVVAVGLVYAFMMGVSFQAAGGDWETPFPMLARLLWPVAAPIFLGKKVVKGLQARRAAPQLPEARVVNAS